MATKKDRDENLGSVPTGSREQVQAGDYAPEGLRGGPPPPVSGSPGPIAPKPGVVSSGGIPSANVLGSDDAPDGDKTI